jgi:hypothetical protein
MTTTTLSAPAPATAAAPPRLEPPAVSPAGQGLPPI